MIKEKTFDVITNEEVITEREETAEEIAHRLELEKNLADNLQAKAELEAKKQEVLAKLGLTSDEVAALLA